MLNINVPQENRARDSESARRACIDEIRSHMRAFRAAEERGRVRRLLEQSVSLTHVHVLTVLRSAGPLAIGSLARTLDVSVASATGIVTRMEERGLVERTRSREDRRVVTVSLTRGGNAALDKLDGRAREHFKKLLEALTLKDLESLQSGFRALRAAHDDLMAELASA